MDHSLDLTFQEPVPMTDEEVREYYTQQASSNSTILFDAWDHDPWGLSSSDTCTSLTAEEDDHESNSSTIACEEEDHLLLLPESSAAATYATSDNNNCDCVEMYICASCMPFLPCAMLVAMGVAAAGEKGYTWFKSVLARKAKINKKNNHNDDKGNSKPARDSIVIADGSNRSGARTYERVQPMERYRD